MSLGFHLVRRIAVLAGTLVALARQGHSPMTPPTGAHNILDERQALEFVVVVFAARAEGHKHFHDPAEANELRATVRQRCLDLLDEWSKIVDVYRETGTQTQYQTEACGAKQLLYVFLNIFQLVDQRYSNAARCD